MDVFVRLISFSIMPSKSIHVVQVVNFHSSIWLSSISSYIYIYTHIHTHTQASLLAEKVKNLPAIYTRQKDNFQFWKEVMEKGCLEEVALEITLKGPGGF